MTGIEQAFVICAAIGGTLFLFRSLQPHLGLRRDAGRDVRGTALYGTYGDLGYKVLSFHSITASIAAFGLAGFTLYRFQKAGTGPALLGATAGGLAAGWLVAQLLRRSARRPSSAEFDPRLALGQRGTVYLAIPEDGTGRISVTINDRLSVLDAVAADRRALRAGDPVEVVGLGRQNVVVVKKV